MHPLHVVNRPLVFGLLLALSAMPAFVRAVDMPFEAIQRQAEAGDASSQLALGTRYALGYSVAKDLVEAKRWLLAAAEQGDARAAYNLAEVHGMTGDNINAVYWGRIAAERGLGRAQLKLGFLLISGLMGEPENDIEGAKWLRRAADQGVAMAQFQLGGLYDRGEGVEENDEEAMRWLLKAAGQGLAGAQYVVGSKYHHGDGVPQNFASARAWYTRAAEQGNASGQSGLATMLEEGFGGPQDLPQAYFWYSLSSGSDAASAEARDRTVKVLTPAQVADVQARTATWKPKAEAVPIAETTLMTD